MSNTEILVHCQWKSKNGYIDITQQSRYYKDNIIKYWYRIRRPQIEKKMLNTVKFIKTTPDKTLRGKLISKNMRRAQVIHLYDQLLNKACL